MLRHSAARFSGLTAPRIPRGMPRARRAFLAGNEGGCRRLQAGDCLSGGPAVEPVVDGVSGFLFLDANDMPCVAMHWEHRMSGAVAKHNRIYREPLPKITPHMCRHSFATRMAWNGMSPARLKYVMGMRTSRPRTTSTPTWASRTCAMRC